jgi:hypothetical protein
VDNDHPAAKDQTEVIDNGLPFLRDKAKQYRPYKEASMRALKDRKLSRHGFAICTGFLLIGAIIITPVAARAADTVITFDDLAPAAVVTAE